ncbi:hypothetical protein LTR17_007980 [Elasticomyces elasticus]|nr:hypothetical protein LTR17_007980 [Elasticomyces elasticus]
MAEDDTFLCACCQGPGTPATLTACTGCYLVHYCNRECQKKHWSFHKASCKSPLARSDWQPEWMDSDRRPGFVNAGAPVVSFGGKSYLWGNVPALDVIQLHQNEGETYKKDLDLLFAASGDLRNVVKSLAALPTTYKNSVSLVLNDRDFEIVARNTLMLLAACAIPEKSTAVDLILHLWYSSTIRPKHLYLLTTHVRPLIEDVVRKVAGKAADSLQRKTWNFGGITVRLSLPQGMWSELLPYFEVPTGLTGEEAHRIRTAVTLARKDHFERKLIPQVPAHRVCKQRFRTTGIMLPFGHSIQDFTVPNPTFFQTAAWPMSDAADPHAGWSWEDVLDTGSGLAKNDLNGKLVIYIKQHLADFYDSLRARACAFSLLNVDAATLQDHVPKSKFARVEVANIVDRGYLGIINTLHCLGPLLQNPSDNPHATMLTLFMNAVPQMFSALPQQEQLSVQKSEMVLANPYIIPPTNVKLPLSQYHSFRVMMSDATQLVRDMDKYFDKQVTQRPCAYAEMSQFPLIPECYGVVAKEPHTIVEKWPLRLKALPHESGAQEAFQRLLSSSRTGAERYVEWKRIV